MPVPTSITDLSTTAASNFPQSADSCGSTLHELPRNVSAIIKKQFVSGSDVTAANGVLTLPSDYAMVKIAGAGATITGFADCFNGRIITIRFDGINTLTHSASFDMPTGGSITTASGDVAIFVNVSSGVWQCVSYDKACIRMAQGANPRNRIINGDMGVDQRNSGAAQTFTAAAALSYCVDRWYGYCTGANVTGQQVGGSGSTRKRYRFTGAASVTGIGFCQRIEAANCYDLNNSTATLSVDLANSLLTTVSWAAYYANTTDTFGTLASPTRTLIASGTFTVNSTVTRYSTQIAIPAAATTGIEIVFSVGAQTSGTWTIGNVQFEYGSAATAFETKPYETELASCQRYFQWVPFNAGGYQIAGGNIYFTLPYFCKMRSVPTFGASEQDPEATGAISNNVDNGTVGAVSSVSTSSFGVGRIQALSTGGLNIQGFRVSASAEL